MCIYVLACSDAKVWFERILLHKHIQMIPTQVLTTYEVHTKNKHFNCVVFQDGKYIKMDFTEVAKLLNKRTCI